MLRFRAHIIWPILLFSLIKSSRVFAIYKDLVLSLHIHALPHLDPLCRPCRS